jgi:hypothetical protein
VAGPVDTPKLLLSPERWFALRGHCGLRRGKGAVALSPLAASFPRCASDRFSLAKPNTSCTIELSASLTVVFGFQSRALHMKTFVIAPLIIVSPTRVAAFAPQNTLVRTFARTGGAPGGRRRSVPGYERPDRGAPEIHAGVRQVPHP